MLRPTVATSKTSRRDRETGDTTKKYVTDFDNNARPFLIGVGGGTASGKSTVCKKIVELIGQNDADETKQVNIVGLESFYHTLSQHELELAAKGQYNFDHPDAFNEKLVLETLTNLKKGCSVVISQYDYVNNRINENMKREVQPADVILFEGILVFYFKEIRDLFDMKLFVDTDSDTRLSRRVLRDMQDRGRDLEQVLHQYINFVKPAFEDFCLPTKKYADVIIPRGADNKVAIDLIVQHIQELLKPTKKNVTKRIRHSSDSVTRPH